MISTLLPQFFICFTNSITCKPKTKRAISSSEMPSTANLHEQDQGMVLFASASLDRSHPLPSQNAGYWSYTRRSFGSFLRLSEQSSATIFAVDRLKARKNTRTSTQRTPRKVVGHYTIRCELYLKAHSVQLIDTYLQLLFFGMMYRRSFAASTYVRCG